ncbi:hypothetical protein SO802_011516 [Lithocarpus litseifolius]|uniref:Protein kinase domain-containing protein n=1 Tax=Lithocarpus litseifolius TaxID=425828 RepID=A0AAW2D4B9_9ROSI
MGNCLDSSAKVDTAQSSHATSGSGVPKFSIRTDRSSAPSSRAIQSFSDKSNASSEILSSPNLKALTFNELKNSTRNFHPDSFLGEGGFGYVFKGWIDEYNFSATKPGSGMAVAVKKLKSERFQGHKKWLEFNAKLADYGLAKAGPTGDRTHVSTQISGTQGYAAPEYVTKGRLTAKSDVTKVDTEQILVNWAIPYLRDKGQLFRIMDTKLEGQYPQKGAYTVATLALKCLSTEAKFRPKMAESDVSGDWAASIDSRNDIFGHWMTASVIGPPTLDKRLL